MKDTRQLRTGLIGTHLAHSFSPLIHAALGDYEYRLIELCPEELATFFEKRDFDALNVTIPYKQKVIPYLSSLSQNATRIGAVNTVIKQADGTLFGDNTDYGGLLDMIDSLGISLTDKKVLVLGSGGASRTAVAVASDLGAREVVVISRNGENNYENLEKHADAEIIINTTPVGMYPSNGEKPLSLRGFPRLAAVYDLIYNPARTALLLEAKRLGIPYRNGLLMLVSQARRAAELFTGEVIPTERSLEIAASIERSTKSIVLVGMPGCGKSTLGSLLATELGLDFIDTDKVLEQKAGIPIPEILRLEGEAGFRKRESAVLRDVCKRGGRVIATGGGVVTVEENGPIMEENAAVLFLDADPATLPTAGRPLSLQKTPAVLYREREHLYRRYADITVKVTRDVEENLKHIKEALKQ
ncbi:MAG: shikimate kinase [Ruminococcaceae bacterium]|nr:shikimate kinase [Oscillospiraceae bacterium]